MIGHPKTRLDIQQETGLRGKELSAYLKQICTQGGVIRQQRYKYPTKSAKKETVYQTVPVNALLPLEEA